MSDKEIVAYAKKVVEEKGIRSRSGLANEDSGLYSVLWKRNLLDRVFALIELADEKDAVQQVVNALREF
jgi:hypothetical protein